ncbi:MAG: aldehyde dehydrogenase family protein, partial [Ramlibacter sp.]|nr:aldehyde dehydrogenase family protein [Ramlibacter sp.]
SSVGTCLASHPDVDLIGFTGSTETGRAIMAAASPTIKKLVMELGGKNPFLILQDADVERAAKLLAFRQFNNAGQHCSSPGRYYVHESVHDEFVAKLVEAASQVVVGDPADPGTGMGPLVSAQHRMHVERCIRSGVEQGATVVFGGGQPAGAAFQNGFFLEPTVMTGVRHEMEVAREEIFGPVACVLKFDDEREVIELANDSVYGLCAGVFSRDVSKALRMASELRVGSVFVNSHMLAPEMPWGGGVKQSGLGKEGSIAGMEEFTELKLVCVDVS